MSRQKFKKFKKTTDTNHITAKARLKKPCECGGWWVECVRTQDYSKIGSRCLRCGKTVLWDVSRKRDTSKN